MVEHAFVPILHKLCVSCTLLPCLAWIFMTLKNTSSGKSIKKEWSVWTYKLTREKCGHWDLHVRFKERDDFIQHLGRMLQRCLHQSRAENRRKLVVDSGLEILKRKGNEMFWSTLYCVNQYKMLR